MLKTGKLSEARLLVTCPYCHRAFDIDYTTECVRGSFVAAVDGRLYFDGSRLIKSRRVAGLIAHLMRTSPETATHQELAAIVEYGGDRPGQIIKVYMSRAHAAAKAAGVTLPVETLIGKGYRWAG